MSDTGNDEHEEQEEVLSIHFGQSANCSSIGSVVDFLFLSGIAGAAVVSSVAILLGNRREAPPISEVRPSPSSGEEE